MAKKIIIYFSNINAFVVYHFLFLLLYITRKKTSTEAQYLFINFGQIGDLSLTSIINDYKLNREQHHILVDERYFEYAIKIFGEFIIKAVNLSKYKKSFFYRVKILWKLRQTKYQNIINLTSSRRILTDEICLLANAQNYICFVNTWKMQKPLFRKYFDNKYSSIYDSKLFNEYDRINHLLSHTFCLHDNTLTIASGIQHKLNIKSQIVVAPFSSHESHSWALEKYFELINLLSKDYKVYVLGDTLKPLKNISGNKNVINKINKTTIVEALEIIAQSLFFVGNDSGLTHIALKFRVPLLGIIGGGNFGRYLPYNESATTKFIYHKLDCYNCEWYCKYQQTLCLQNITVDEVFSECEKILALLKSKN